MIEEWEVEYGAKRPLKFRTFVADSFEREDFFDDVVDYVAGAVNLKTYQAMEREKRYRLIERIAILVCKQYAPTANYGITKPEVRAAVAHAIQLLSKE